VSDEPSEKSLLFFVDSVNIRAYIDVDAVHIGEGVKHQMKPRMLNRLWKTDAPLTFTGLLMLLALAAALVGLIVDPRLITGMPAWLKPAKFALSIAVYVFTLAWMFTFIPGFRRVRRIVGWVTAIVMLLEWGIIALQAWRGTTSHFNVSTPVNAVLFAVMGGAIATQTLSSIAVAVALWRQKFEDQSLGWALRLGMIITIVGAFTGGLMTRPTAAQLAAAHAGQSVPVIGAHTVGAPDGGPGIPGTGWSTQHGDVRVPHFVGLHALQALILIALVLKRRRLPADARTRLTLTAAGGYFALFAILLAEALRGEPVLHPDALTIGILCAWALVTLFSAWRSVTRALPVAALQTI
jgi:hypothetical protein